MASPRTGRGGPGPSRSRSALAALLAVAVSTSAPPVRALTDGEIAGTWRLLAYVHTDADGTTTTPLGEHPHGTLVIGSDGRYTIIAAASDRRPAQDEAGYAQLMKTMIGYSAHFTSEADGHGLKITIRPDVAWNPTMVGTSLVRYLSMEHHELVVRSPPSPHGTFTARFTRAR